MICSSAEDDVMMTKTQHFILSDSKECNTEPKYCLKSICVLLVKTKKSLWNRVCVACMKIRLASWNTENVYSMFTIWFIGVYSSGMGAFSKVLDCLEPTHFSMFLNHFQTTFKVYQLYLLSLLVLWQPEPQAQSVESMWTDGCLSKKKKKRKKIQKRKEKKRKQSCLCEFTPNKWPMTSRYDFLNNTGGEQLKRPFYSNHIICSI